MGTVLPAWKAVVLLLMFVAGRVQAQYCNPSFYNATSDHITHVAFGAIDNASDGSDYVVDYTDMEAEVAQGESYTLSVSIVANGNEYVYAFFDWDQNGSFNDYGEKYDVAAGVGTEGPHTVPITVPITAMTGTTRMRVMMARNGSNLDPCNSGQYDYGEAEDYTVNVGAGTPCSAPHDPGSTTGPAEICAGNFFLLGLSDPPTQLGYDYEWYASTDGLNFDLVATGAPTFMTNLYATTTYYCMVTCGPEGTPSGSVPLTVTATPFTECYCTPTAGCYYDYIANVTMAGIDRTSECDDDQTGYVLFTDETGSLTAGSTGNPFSVTLNFQYYVGAAAWIDWNQDGQFSFDEQIFSRSYQLNETQFTGTFDVPLDTKTGQTRIRVRSGYFMMMYPGDACLNASGGETEDYIVEILAAPTCNGLPAPGAITAPDEVCPHTGFTLAMDPVAEYGISYQWESSPAGEDDWTAIPGATDASMTASEGITTETDYHLLVTCANGGTTASQTVTVPVTPFGQCYCIPAINYGCGGDYISNVTIAGINRTSVCDNLGGSNAYSLITDVTGSLNAGSTGNPYSVTTDGDREGAAAWIDWNQDGQFTADELIFSSSPQGPPYTHAGTFDVPLTALAGQTHMRVRCTYNASLAGESACTARTYGETEDYLVEITPAVDCAGTPVLEDIDFPPTVCEGTSFTLTGKGVPEMGITYQWETAPAGTGNWEPVAGATGLILTVDDGLMEGMDFRLVATCAHGGVPGVSNVAAITVTDNVCQCTAYNAHYANDSGGISISNVTVGTLDNSSDCATPAPGPGSLQGRYGNFTGYVAAPDLEQGSSIPFSLTATVCGHVDDNAFQIYIDWDHDGQFSLSERVYNQMDPEWGDQTQTGTFTVPYSSTAGITRMRVVSVEKTEFMASRPGHASFTANPWDDFPGYGTNFAENDFYYGETEDYCVNVMPGTPCTGTTPLPAITAPEAICPGTTYDLDGTEIQESGIAYQWESSLAGMDDWAPVAGATGVDRTVEGGISEAMDYRLTATCVNGGEPVISNVVTVSILEETCRCTAYPMVYANYADDEEISHVVVGTLDNSSDCNTPAPGLGSVLNRYANYTGFVPAPELQMGSTVDFSLTSTSCSMYTSNNGFQLYIDWNQDGDFLDAGERVYGAATNASGQHTETGSFQVPMEAIPGITRMRVVNVYAMNPSDNYAQSSYNYGETEDYCVNVVQGPPCSGVPVIEPITGPSGVCEEQPFNLHGSWIFGSGLTYQWESAPAGTGNWEAIAGEELPTLMTVDGGITAGTDYRLVATCANGGAQGQSNVLQVAINPEYLCPCIPVGTNSGRYINSFTTTGGTSNINNTNSGFSPGGYGNFTEMLVAQDPGGGVNFTASMAGGTFGVRIWVDWNHDGVFDVANEVAYQSSNFYGTHSGTIMVPLTALPGQAIMRVACHWYDGSGNVDPCSTNHPYGEFEDYTFLVAAVPDCHGDPGGTAYEDNCGQCVGGNTGLEPCVQDCHGDWGGTAYEDNCGQCVGGNTGATACVPDCHGDWGGAAYEDNCGQCVGGNTGATACVQDCHGDWGGAAYEDNCGQCVGGNTGATACVQDCHGDWGGTAYEDNCGECVGGDTGLEPCVPDCHGDWGGTAYEDNCGQCVGGNTGGTACVQDCAGTWGGAALPGTPCTGSGFPGTWEQDCHCELVGPDVAVHGVTADADTIAPNDVVNVGWYVVNVGSAPATEDWTERIYLEPATGGARTLITQVAYDSGHALQAGDSVARTHAVQLPASITVGDEVRFVVELLPGPGLTELPGSTANNTGTQEGSITVRKLLAVAGPSTLMEGASMTLTVQRTGSLAQALTVNVGMTEAARFNFPATVTIQAGQSSRAFTVQALSNNDHEGPIPVELSVSATDFTGAQHAFTLLDDDLSPLALSGLPATVTEGDAFVLTVSVATPLADPLDVALSSSKPSRLPVPASVTIPAGGSSVAVPVTVPQNDIPELDMDITVQASATGYAPMSATTHWTDDDMIGLQLVLSTDTVSESGGLYAAQGTLLRLPEAPPMAFSATLSADLPNTLILPGGVSLAANENSKSFNIGVVDNALMDGFRDVTITAALVIPGCGCGAPPSSAGHVQALLTVADNDGPTLTLAPMPMTMAEGLAQAGLLRVERNTPTDTALTVMLWSSDEGEAILPPTAVIPAGSAHVDVPVTTVDDGVTDGNQMVYLNASAEGFAPGITWIMVTDMNKPDLAMSDVVVESLTIPAGEDLIYTATVRNVGFATAPSGVRMRTYLSTNGTLDANDVLLGERVFSDPIPAGASMVVDDTLALPTTVGNYQLLLQVNPDGEFSELSYTNNVSTPQAIAVVAPLTATASTPDDWYLPATAIPVSGTAQWLNGTPATNQAVEVYVILNGTRRTVSATTDGTGAFTAVFNPLPNEAGHYSLGACYPTEGATAAQDAFDILGVKVNNGQAIQWLATLGNELQGTVAVTNLGQTALPNLTLAITQLPSGAVIAFDTIPQLAGGATDVLHYHVLGTELSGTFNYQAVGLRAHADQGDLQPVQAWYYCQAPGAYLVADQDHLDITTSSTLGQQVVQLRLVNIGMGLSGPVQVNLPQADFLSLMTPATMPDMATGDTAVVTLRFQTVADMPFDFPVNGSFTIVPANGNTLNIPFTFTKVSQTVGQVEVEVTDEFSYYAQGGPKVEGAEVTIKHYYTGQVYAQGLTGSDGLFLATDIPEGTHRITVTKDQHTSYTGTVTVVPGGSVHRSVFLEYEAITFSWTVVPTPVEDEYSVTLTMVFETNVPMPVVTIDMPDTMPQLFGDEQFAFPLTMINHGLIAAENVTLSLPEDDEYEFLAGPVPQTLGALSSVQVPVVMRRRDVEQQGIAPPTVAGVSQTLGMREAAYLPYVDRAINCQGYSYVLYSYNCGPNGVWKKSSKGTVYQGRTCTVSIPCEGCGPGGCTNCGSSGPPCYYCPGPGVGGENPTLAPWSGIPQKAPDCKDCINEMSNTWKGCTGPLGNLYDPFATGEDNTPLAQLNKAVSRLSKGKADGLFAANNCLTKEYWGDKMTCLSWMVLNKRFPCGSHMAHALIVCVQSMFYEERPLSAQGFREGPDPNNPYMQAAAHMGVIDTATWAEAELLDEVYGQMPESDAFWTLLPMVAPYVAEPMAIGTAEVDSIVIAMDGYEITEGEIQAFAARWNASVQAWGEGVLSPDGTHPGIVDRNKVDSLMTVLQDADDYAVANGFNSLLEMTRDVYTFIDDLVNQGSGSVCATVTIQLSQTVTMTREAFTGTLEVFNGHPSEAMDSLQVQVLITDEDGVPGNGLFQINTQAINNLGDVDGTGTLASQGTGSVQFLMIPTIAAAPTQPKLYNFGGVVTYWDPYVDTMVTFPLNPVQLMVNPSPNLMLHYFMQRNILGDDALTPDVVEPSIPAELAVMVENQGYGPAVNLQISSAQPEVVANESGLAINFQLIGSNFQGEPTALGVTDIHFGTVPPLGTRIGEWYMTSSLLGKFVSYQADVVHNNSFGNPELSLIQGAEIHELAKSIRVYGSMDDGLNDFLVNDLFDSQDVPDRIFLSQGMATYEVVQASGGSFSSPVQPPSFTNTLTVTASEEGWNYIKLDDPGNGEYELVSVTRDGDGQAIPLDNAWLTFVTLPTGQQHFYENKFHFVDDFAQAGMPVSYTVVWTPKNFDVPAVTRIDGAPDGVSATQVTELTVVFSKPIDASTFTHDDLTLVFQGGPNIMDASALITQVNDTVFTVDLSALTTGNGTYVFTAQAAGVADMYGINGLVGKQVSWTQYMDVPMVQAFQGIPSPAIASSYSTMQVLFNLPIDVASAPADRFTFTHEGQPVAGQVVIDSVSADGRLFHLSGLGVLLTEEGSYELTVDLPNIRSDGQVYGLQPQSITLTVDNVGPLLVTLQPVTAGGLDAQHRTYVDIVFNEGVSGFNTGALWLTRNGDPVILNIAQLAYQSPTTWKAGSFGLETYPDGEYVFTVDMGQVHDVLGNYGSGVEQVAWTVDRSALATVTNLRIDPDLGWSDSDGVSSILAVDVLFTLGADAAQVKVYQVTYGQETLLATLSAVPAGPVSVPVTFPTGGNTSVKVVATGSNGMPSSDQKTLYLDQSPLTASWGMAQGLVQAVPVIQIPVTFSDELLDDSGLAGLLTLRRNGAPLSTAGLTVTATGGAGYLVAGLDAIDQPGQYELSIDLGALHKRSSGRAGAAQASVQWTLQEPSVVRLSVRVFLQGPYDAVSGLMHDSLRVQGLIPLMEPYTGLGYTDAPLGGVMIQPGVLSATGPDAIVDWVVVELRQAAVPTNVVAAKAVLVRRDGDVVDVDGSSPLVFGVSPGNYYVAIRHRNHLGAMTAGAQGLSATAVMVDLTQASAPAYGTEARCNLGGAMGLWAGNALNDDRLKFTGPGNDRDKILQLVGGYTPTNVVQGYHNEDGSMDGQVKYTGQNNDRDLLLINIGADMPTRTRLEQLPK